MWMCMDLNMHTKSLLLTAAYYGHFLYLVGIIIARTKAYVRYFNLGLQQPFPGHFHLGFKHPFL